MCAARLTRSPASVPPAELVKGVGRTAHSAAKDLHLMPKPCVLKLELADASAPT